MSTRLRLRRADGEVYQDRWGIECRWVGVFVHRFAAPDPGVDLHDHPWPFVSLVLRGGYVEERCSTADAVAIAADAERLHRVHFERFGRRVHYQRAPEQRRRWLSVRRFPLDECHRITKLARKPTWTLVVRGPRRRVWGFYLPTGRMPWPDYDATIRAERRDLFADIERIPRAARPPSQPAS